MGFKNRLVERSKKLAMTPRVIRVLSDDRVMRAAEGIMDARGRMKAAAGKAGEAWQLLMQGHALPNIDPAIDDDLEVRVSAPRVEINGNGSPSNGHSIDGHAKTNGNGKAHTNGNGTAHATDHGTNGAGDELAASMASRTSLAMLGGRDVFEKAFQFRAADNARKMGVYPFFRPLDLNDGPEAVLEGRRVIMFGSNNYLGLTTHPKVREAAIEAINKYGTSMTGSRLVNGSMKLHNELEEKLAAFYGKESALVFTTGYQVNLATISALLSNKKCVAVIDRNDHASIYDGVRLCQAVGARMVRYKHNDPEALDKALSELAPDEGAFVITDGVFSAEGEIARLPEIVSVVKKHKARIFVDDAHALGVIGPSGRGTAAHFGIVDQVDLMGGTFSKSLASIGGWLVGERKVLDYIQHFASSFMFAASAAPPCVAAAMASLDVMQEETWRIDQLRKNYTYMREELIKLGFDVGSQRDRRHPDLRTTRLAHHHDVERAARRRTACTPTRSFRPAFRPSKPCFARATWRPTPETTSIGGSKLSARSARNSGLFDGWPRGAVGTASAMPADVREISIGGDLRPFLDVVDRIYRDDPMYVRPLDLELKDRLSKKNPFFGHADGTCFVAFRNGRVAGRITAQIDRSHLDRHKDEAGFFGFLDTIDDAEICRALIDRASSWLKARGHEAHSRAALAQHQRRAGLLGRRFRLAPDDHDAPSSRLPRRAHRTSGARQAERLLRLALRRGRCAQARAKSARRDRRSSRDPDAPSQYESRRRRRAAGHGYLQRRVVRQLVLGSSQRARATQVGG